MVSFVDDQAVDLDRWYEAPSDAAYVVPISHFSKAALERFGSDDGGVAGIPLPWKQARHKWAIRSHELTVWAGINGSGKSLVTSHVAMHLAAQGQRVCLASLEMKPAVTLYRMTRQALGERAPLRERITALHANMDGLVWLFDHQGTCKWHRMVALGRYLASELGIQQLFVDSLMKLGVAPDDYAGQKQAVDELCALAHDTGLHVHLVHHARKGQSEDAVIDKFAIKGAGEIVDLADNGVLVWRNKRKEREAEKTSGDAEILKEPDVLLSVVKQRDGEWEGPIRLDYHTQSMQLIDRGDDQAFDYAEAFAEP